MLNNFILLPAMLGTYDSQASFCCRILYKLLFDDSLGHLGSAAKYPSQFKSAIFKGKIFLLQKNSAVFGGKAGEDFPFSVEVEGRGGGGLNPCVGGGVKFSTPKMFVSGIVQNGKQLVVSL